MHDAFVSVVKQALVFLLLCVGGLSYAESAEQKSEKDEFFNLFINIQCQYYADWAGLDDARDALWDRNNNVMNYAMSDEEIMLSSFDVAFMVNQQYDHAASNLIEYMYTREMTEEEAAQLLYITYCNDV